MNRNSFTTPSKVSRPCDDFHEIHKCLIKLCEHLVHRSLPHHTSNKNAKKKGKNTNYALKHRMASTAPIFRKSTSAHRNYMEFSYMEFYRNRSTNMVSANKNSLVPLRKGRLSLNRLSRDSRLLGVF